MKYKIIHFFSRVSNRLRQGKDQKKEWKRYVELSKNLPESKQTNLKNSLIIRLDDIGDFLLLAPVLSAWIQDQNQHLFMLANKAWKPYFDVLIQTSKIECIWLDKNEWFSSFEYRKSIIEQLVSISPEEVIYASYTRVLLLEGIIKKCLSASKHLAWETKPGPFSQELNSGFSFLKKRIIGLHETQNNLAFFEDINKGKIETDFYLNFPSNKRKIEQTYFIICPGGNQKSKQWPANKYAEIANLVLDKNPDLTCVLVGGLGDEKISKEINEGIHSTNTINLIGKTNLIELAEICKNASFAFSNDTSAAHLCALQKTPVYVVVNGNRYGRFFPYPKSFEKVAAIYPNLDKPIYDWEEKMPIASVTSKKLWKEILKKSV